MNSPSRMRTGIVAVLLGVLIGGGLIAVTPAGAQVAKVATNWTKIWKNELQPLADKRYYTKSKSDKRFAAKKDTYTKAESDAKYQPKGNYALTGSSYTKAESDGRYLPKRALITGPWALSAAPAGTTAFTAISFGATLSAPPTFHIIPPGTAPSPTCPGTAAAPDAAAGQLCLYAAQISNQNAHTVANLRADGAIMTATSTNNSSYTWGSYAVRPAGYAAARVAAPSTGR